MSILSSLALALLVWLSQARRPAAIIEDRTHPSQVFGETRNYRVFLPPGYSNSQQRYPVIYWFHGWSERFNRPVRGDPHSNYDAGEDYGGDNIANFVAGHDVIVVKWDGYNPRSAGEDYLRPYNISPVETARQFPLYFPELVEHIDQTYRTLADREHRATAGLSMGGFMSYWVAGKYPELVGSASNFMGSSEFSVGPRGFDVEYRHEEMHINYEGVRTRLVTGARDFIQFYHRRMNAIWNYMRAFHETEDFDAPHGTPGMAKTLDFHMKAFAHPLPRPAVWRHADAYPNFRVWDWEVVSNRREPGLTVLENVSKSGFRSAVREWLPEGAVLAGVKLSIASAKMYAPGSQQSVTYIRLRDGTVKRERLRADAEGRLNFELDGEAYEVGVGAGAVLALAGYTVEGASWATAGKPLKVRVRFWNKGSSRSATTVLKWETPNPGVTMGEPPARLFALNPGESAEVVLSFTVKDSVREVVQWFAVDRGERLPLEIPLFPEAAPAQDSQVADGRVVKVWQHAVEKLETALGEGNGDGNAAPGEQFVVLLPDGDALRPAELFTNDGCIDNSRRASDGWGNYDHVGASVKYSLPRIKADCPPGHRVRMMARIQLPNKPNHTVRYAAIEIPVWWRTGGGAAPAAR